MKSKLFLLIFFLVVFPGSAHAQSALTDLAKSILTQGYNPKITDIKSQLDSGDYATVKNIGLLPDNPLYIFKYAAREVTAFFVFDPATKAHLLLQNGNTKTLESLLVLGKATSISTSVLDSVGRDFDYVSANIASVDKDEAVKFAGIYLKHQVLLQQEEDRLSEQDFLKVEAVRVKYLASLAHITAIDSSQLPKIIGSQVGSNYKELAAAAILRDLENSANQDDMAVLQSAQKTLLSRFQTKLAKLSQKDRLSEIKRYASFIHGNPVRQFQAYDQIAKIDAKSNLRDKAAQNLKKHLLGLDNPGIQATFAKTLFSEYPIDLRVLFYTEIQLKDADQITRLNQVKTILGAQICQNFGSNPDRLAQTRFYNQSIKNPDVLDTKISQFLVTSIKNCASKNDTALKLVTDLQKTIDTNFVKQAKVLISPTAKLPTKAQAEKILKEEGLEVASQDEQQTAELIEEEIQAIEQEAAVPETVVEEVKVLEEPTQEEVIAKEEQIVEEIVAATKSGTTSPLIEDLPPEVQKEIVAEAEAMAPTPTPTPTPVSLPTPTPIVVSSPTPIPSPEPTLIETVESMAPSPTPVMEMMPPAPAL